MYMSGVTVHSTLLSSRFNVVVIDRTCPIESQENCPSCDTNLSELCRIIGSGVQLRVGVCSSCGYQGFVDRPKKEWIVRFYAEHWDREFPKAPEIMWRDVELSKEGMKASRYHTVELARVLQADTTKAYLEIGVGYGQVMKNIESLGFRKLVGVENSAIRAERVSRVFGFNVIQGDFGSREVEVSLGQHAPFSLVLSHHVFEHTYYPRKVIESIGRLQDEGDWLILAIPNAEGEHINHRALYLPHLHAFTKESLEHLLNRCGYRVVQDASPDPTNIIIAAQKTATSSQKIFKYNVDYVTRARERLRTGLGSVVLRKGMNLLEWHQQFDGSDRVKTRALGVFGWPLWLFRQAVSYIRSRLFGRLAGSITMLVSPTLEEGDDISVRFPGVIKLLVK